jgi:hypothetical protein
VTDAIEIGATILRFSLTLSRWRFAPKAKEEPPLARGFLSSLLTSLAD